MRVGRFWVNLERNEWDLCLVEAVFQCHRKRSEIGEVRLDLLPLSLPFACACGRPDCGAGKPAGRMFASARRQAGRALLGFVQISLDSTFLVLG